MLEKIIDMAMKETEKISGEGVFRIGSEPIREFIRFQLIAKYLQEECFNKKQSINQYARENQQGYTKDTFEDKNYERTLDHFHSLNNEKKIAYREIQNQEEAYRAQKEGGDPKMGNPNRYKGNELFEYQIQEFKVLNDIKGKKYDFVKANQTYKRINSEKGYMNKINFREFTDYIDVLRCEIDDTEGEYRNIRYYKLEKRLNYELIKAISVAIHKCVENGENQECVVKDLVPLLWLPVIKDRSKYADGYPELNETEKKRWRTEVKYLPVVIAIIIKLCNEDIAKVSMKNIITNQDLEEFKQIYADGLYKNNYRQRKDFSAADFKAIMIKLDEMKVNEWNKIKNKDLKERPPK